MSYAVQSHLDRPWWRLLTKLGSLVKGMANHFTVLALRTPWTMWFLDCVVIHQETVPNILLMLIGQKGVQRMRWLDNIMDSMGMNLSKLWEIVKDSEVWHAAVQGVSKRWTWLSNRTTVNSIFQFGAIKVILLWTFLWLIFQQMGLCLSNMVTPSPLSLLLETFLMVLVTRFSAK